MISNPSHTPEHGVHRTAQATTVDMMGCAILRCLVKRDGLAVMGQAREVLETTVTNAPSRNLGPTALVRLVCYGLVLLLFPGEIQPRLGDMCPAPRPHSETLHEIGGTGRLPSEPCSLTFMSLPQMVRPTERRREGESATDGVLKQGSQERPTCLLTPAPCARLSMTIHIPKAPEDLAARARGRAHPRGAPADAAARARGAESDLAPRPRSAAHGGDAARASRPRSPKRPRPPGPPGAAQPAGRPGEHRAARHTRQIHA